ncbi:MAG: hypothetical protein M1820_006775 [Bogoriella megaspora]|nr:MAG: hypothetical protein M1820_006775 [Bogoriella megaspora]
MELSENEEPLVDTTAPIPLRSKRTERLQRKQLKRSKKNGTATGINSILELPSEILIEILSFARPSDVFNLLRASRDLKSFIDSNEKTICRTIISRRYAVLTKCFPLPIPLNEVDRAVYPALQSEKRQELLKIHKKPYLHIKPADEYSICTCLTCLFAWNNLCLLIDLAHWIGNLERREPIPTIPRGRNPEWNQSLVNANGLLVERAISHPLWYARILQEHLHTTTRNIQRSIQSRNTNPAFQMSIDDAKQETDVYLERSGLPSYDIPYHRDSYYSLVTYLPNRKWHKVEQRWLYYAESQHERDLEWIQRQNAPQQVGERKARQKQKHVTEKPGSHLSEK